VKVRGVQSVDPWNKKLLNILVISGFQVAKGFYSLIHSTLHQLQS
jgi:hypothetical protein